MALEVLAFLKTGYTNKLLAATAAWLFQKLVEELNSTVRTFQKTGVKVVSFFLTFNHQTCHMRKSILALVFSFSLLNVFSQDKRIEGLDSFINRLLKDYKAAGLAIAIVEKNKVVLLKGYGYRDLEKKIPVNDETLFAIGSCTKAFTSSLLGILAQENKLDIDKPVFNYLPELRFYTEGLSEQVTTRDMMSHRTGPSPHDYSWYGSTVGRDSLLRRIRYFEPSGSLA
jgi:CubicO group peptidase (beta-lactamase class C family)